MRLNGVTNREYICVPLFIVAAYFFVGKLNIFTIFGISTDYLFWIFLFISLLPLIIVRIPHMTFKLNVMWVPYIIYIIYLGVEAIRSRYTSIGWRELLFNVLVFIYFALIYKAKGSGHLIFNFFKIGGWYFTVTVLLQAIIPSFLNAARRVLLSSTDYAISQQGYENTTNYLSGLSPNSATAGFFLSIFVCILLGEILIKGRRKPSSIVGFILGLVAILLTQKRTLLLGTAVAIVIIVFVLSKGLQSKLKYLIISLAIAAIAIFILARFVPAMQTLFVRLFENEDFLSGRLVYYDKMWEWFSSNPLLGVGIGVADGTWGFGGHNCYLQLLAETGIIGFVLYALILIPLIGRCFKMTYKYWNDKNFVAAHPEYVMELLGVSFSVTQILIYAITGNPFYDYTFCLAMFTLLAIPNQIREGLKAENAETRLAQYCNTSL